MEGSPVQLSGVFHSMSNIAAAKNHRRAEYELVDCVYPESKYGHLIPQVVMMDSLWRFSAIDVSHDRTMPVYVPEKCDNMKVYFDLADFHLPALMEKMIFSGANPRGEGDVIRIGPVEARDPDGNIMLVVEGGVCRKFGEISNAV
jgi:hypothetical protein